MKIIFLTTQFPYPLDNGGKIGAFNGISVASKEYDVTVLSFSEEPQFIDEGLKFYKNKFSRVKFESPIIHDIHIRKKIFKLINTIFFGYLKKLPYIVAKFDDKKMYKKIDDLFKNQKWDIVFIDYLNMSQYGDYIKKKYANSFNLFILKDHNIEYELVKQESASSKRLKKIFLELEWKRTYKYEYKAVKKADLVFSVCDSNTEILKKINNNSYTMHPTYEMLPERHKLTNKKSILYMGNLSWKSNMDGLKWFVENVFPLIKKEVPEATFSIVGGGYNQNPFKQYKDINYLGYVKDISQIYDDYKVFIVPLFEGSGIRIKILEAFNNEIAVVSTTLGCDTIGAENGKEILIADNAEDFSQSVAELLLDDEKNNKVRKAGKKLLDNKFSLSVRQKEFKKIISNLYKENENE